VTSRAVVIGVVFLQLICAIFLVSEIAISVIGLPISPIDWQLYEFVQIGAALGLLLGVVVGAVVLRRIRRRTERAETALRAASGAFMEVLEERFLLWGLTPAERDVALFAMKGLTTQEIASLRNTSEGTVKAQTNAIYRKADVGGRPQLLSVFIDELMNSDD